MKEINLNMNTNRCNKNMVNNKDRIYKSNNMIRERITTLFKEWYNWWFMIVRWTSIGDEKSTDINRQIDKYRGFFKPR